MSLSSKIPHILFCACPGQWMITRLKGIYNAIEQWDALWRFCLLEHGYEQTLTG